MPSTGKPPLLLQGLYSICDNDYKPFYHSILYKKKKIQRSDRNKKKSNFQVAGPVEFSCWCHCARKCCRSGEIFDCFCDLNDQYDDDIENYDSNWHLWI